ncbi:LAMI_0E03400g1_1 [Lachancea mirantina]|uniref:ferroxidase n=1 Tax=Lachancea mirantina TaxID=1230905 RepID=A0A1G4JK76_9SACH|nr:LAMI_0E03400g1_1 [Lachancea mirantina]
MLRRSVLGFSTLVTRNAPAAVLTRAATNIVKLQPLRVPVSTPISNIARPYASASTDGHEIPQEILTLTNDVYHEKSDQFLQALQDNLEEISDEYPEVIPDVELSQGVMTLVVPELGTYVINKQPPNKQIWLASPVSGPNRFDLYGGEWVSLRDGSKLLDLLRTELNSVLPEKVDF